MLNNTVKEVYLPLLALILFSIFFIIAPIWQAGIIVGGDFIFPYTHSQLGEFYEMGNTYWTYNEIPTGSSISHNNLYPIHLLSGIFYFFNFSGADFQKVFLTFVVTFACLSSYIFLLKITRNSFSAFVGSVVYIFSPVFYNYFSMGWVWVLFFIALLPLMLVLVQKYFENDDYWAVVLLGLLVSISFAQSQAIIWTPLVVFIYAISLLSFSDKSFSYIVKKVFIVFISIMSIVFVVHISWILPIVQNLLDSTQSTVLNSVSSYDFIRFNSNSAVDFIRGWGSMFNSQYEISYGSKLEFLTFIPPVIVAAQFLYKSPDLLKYKILSALLVFVPFVFFIFKDVLLYLPFTSIIRDLNRFIILLQFGLAISIAIFIAEEKISLIVKISLSIVLLFLISPFLNGGLFAWSSDQGKGQSARFLEVPQKQIEGMLKKYSGQKNLLLPTGAHIGTINNPYFKNSYSEIADFDSYYSPYASGIYTSDKSNVVTSRFAKHFVASSMQSDGNDLAILMKIYGINNIFIRTNLFSTYNRNFNYKFANYPFCKNVTYKSSSDFSIDRVCSINGVYPLIFSADDVQYYDKNNFFDKFIFDGNSKQVTISQIDHKDIKRLDALLEKESKGELIAPEVNFMELERYRYQVDIDNIKTDYVIVLNQTFDDGWKIVDTESGEEMEFDKISINGLVNGWIIPKIDDIDRQKFIIEYRPQLTYTYYRNISIIAFFLLLFTALYLSSTIKLFNRK